MKKIKLSQNKYVLVDDIDFEKLNKWKWYFLSSGYAVHDITRNGKKETILMHRLITDCYADKIVDHINGNKLDNRRSNLRTVTQHENQLNRSKINKNNSSGLNGVSWHKLRNKWRSRIMIHGKEIHLGLFTDKNEAKNARFAYLNQIGGNI